MGKETGFLEINRKELSKRPIEERAKDYKEVAIPLTEGDACDQAARCMNCGIPFCHNACPTGSLIPEWNDLVYNGLWKEAYEKLIETNDFPEFTGRVCPALCEGSCVLSLDREAVSIRAIELAISEKAHKEGWTKPVIPTKSTGKKVAVVGSGPAGLAAALHLNRAGHKVTVFEKADRFGGILKYSIPNFKLEKSVVKRRIEIMEQEGIVFKENTHVGVDYSVEELKKNFDVICLAGGSRVARDLPVEGRNLKGIHFAMDYLEQQNRRYLGDNVDPKIGITAGGKHVVVIGGGDTGSDCVGTAVRQGATSIRNLELMPEPSPTRGANNPWPEWPFILRVSTSHQEAEQNGQIRQYSVMTKRFIGDDEGNVKQIEIVKSEFLKDPATGRMNLKEVEGSNVAIDADLVLLAMGFVNPERELLNKLGVELNERGNVKVDEAKATSVEGVFCAGDMERGQSLVVWALAAGQRAAKSINKYLSK